MTAPTILLVDDDVELREGMRTVLERRGYRTLQAGDGVEARELIERQAPDLVILDMMMPRLGGLPVLEHFEKRSDAPPFLMITATEGDVHKKYAERIGVKDYIQKPFPVKRLLQGIEKCLGKPPSGESATEPSPQVTSVESAESSMLRCQCPACGARMRAPVQLLGQT